MYALGVVFAILAGGVLFGWVLDIVFWPKDKDFDGKYR
jgi:hypothetical protein